ncbi:MAG: Glu-tRNA(Gln) amidotransferase subunit GatE, partial [Candidatus Pacearchaeota archaeon]|nr:Glu-tRNA(Gln) amidotransferase subunit GatE [Candidatus Pacearchaeota archaeon]
LDTHKLFCKCPSLIRQEEPDIIVKRKLHAVAGETGKIDVAASYEESKKKTYVYEAYRDTTCLVELDEEPPHEINDEALRIALQISLLLNAKPFEITQIMRKTVIDGSNPSGFQRTLLLAYDGFVKLNNKKIPIQTICLEEDSARIIKQTETETFFRVDRLGIPLVEITTAPIIETPEEAKEVALKIGEILRSCKVKRGLGTIRQDINMSIMGKSRIEIKGVQEPNLIVQTIKKEIERQLNLLAQGKEIQAEVRKAEQDGSTTFLRPLPGAARMYPETDLPLIKITKKLLSEIKKTLTRPIHEIKAELEKNIHSELVKALLKENKLEEYKVLIKIYNSQSLVAKMLSLWPKEISKSEKIPIEKVRERLNIDTLEIILEKLKEGKIEEAQVKEIMREIAKGKNVEEALKKEKVEINLLEKEIKQLVKEKPGLSVNAYMGVLMQKYKGKVNARKLCELVKNILSSI